MSCADLDAQRALFEASGKCPSVHKGPDGFYLSHDANMMFLGWQAALAAQAPVDSVAVNLDAQLRALHVENVKLRAALAAQAPVQGEPVCTECEGRCGFTESGCGEGCCQVGVMCEACCGTGLQRVQAALVAQAPVSVRHDSDCSLHNAGVPEMLGPCDCSAAQAPVRGGPVELTDEQVRNFGGIVHRDGNVFFKSIAALNAAIDAARKAAG